MQSPIIRLLCGVWVFGSWVSAVNIDWSSDSSIKSGAAQIAYGMMKWYTGNNTGDVPGNLPDPYYWWEAGAMFGTLIDYWAWTGDETYNQETYQAMQHQVGDDHDFMPTNQTLSEGNDDQGFWALTAMTAAETNFVNPNTTGGVQWLALAQAVFNEYAWRWDPTTCEGGLRWQIFTFNNGYTYKNSVANGCFFNLAARLARYTGNTTYADWAEKVFKWERGVGYIDDAWNVYDGSSDTSNCTDINKAQFSYNAGLYLHGAAVMYNYTNGSAEWATATEGLAKRSAEFFFKNDIMYEPPCEEQKSCSIDNFVFKGLLTRFMAHAMQMMPSVYNTLYPLLLASAKDAALQCSGTATASHGAVLDGYACGFAWTAGASWDGTSGVGQQMSALQAVFFTLFQNAPVPYTAVTGGTSTGDTSGGSDKADSILKSTIATRPITTGDRVGAALVTTIGLAGFIGAISWMVLNDR